MKLLRALLPLVLLSPVALAQNTWYVDDDGTAPGSGSQSDPYTSIQYAIEQSSTQEGDTLMVARVLTRRTSTSSARRCT